MTQSLCALAITSASLGATTLETGTFHQLLEYADVDTLFCIDVDNTLIESSQHLGSAQWRNHVRSKIRGAGYPEAELDDILEHFWCFVQPYVVARLVEPGVPAVLDQLKQASVTGGY